MARGVWGLDVSKSSLKAVRLEQKGTRVEITDIDSIDYTPAPTRDDTAIEQEMRMALSLFTSHHNLKKDTVAVSLPSHATFNRFIKLPPTDPARLKDIIQYEAQQHIPFPINEVIWRYERVERVYQPGEEIEAVIFAIKRELVDQFLAVMALSGINVDVVQFAPIAIYNYIRFQESAERNLVILDMGASNTDLILIEDHKFWIRNLPIVGNDLTKAVQQKFDLPFNEAEKLKMSAAQSPQAGKIFAAVQPVLKDLVGEIHRSIGFYKSLSPMGKAPNFNRMVGMGSGTRIIYFDEFVSQRLQMEIIRLKKTDRLDINPKLDAATVMPQLATLGVALGLALQPLNATPTKINLLPEELVRSQRAVKRKPFITATLVTAALILVMMFLQAMKVSSDLEEAYRQSDILTKKWKANTKALEEAKRMEEIVAKLDTMVRKVPQRGQLETLFSTLQNKIPVLTKPVQLPAAGYLNKGDETALKLLEESWRERVWLLRLESTEKVNEADKEKKKVLEVVMWFGLFCRLENGVPDQMATLNFLKEQVAKPLKDAFNLASIPDPVPEDGGVVSELKTNDENPKSSDNKYKYYRFKLALTIPIS